MQTYFTYEQILARMSMRNNCCNVMTIAHDREMDRLQKLYNNASKLMFKYGLGHEQTVYALVASGITLNDAEAIVSQVEQDINDEAQKNHTRYDSILTGSLMAIVGTVFSCLTGLFSQA